MADFKTKDSFTEDLDPVTDRLLVRSWGVVVWPLMVVTGIILLGVRIIEACDAFWHESCDVFGWLANRRRLYRANKRQEQSGE